MVGGSSEAGGGGVMVVGGVEERTGEGDGRKDVDEGVMVVGGVEERTGEGDGSKDVDGVAYIIGGNERGGDEMERFKTFSVSSCMFSPNISKIESPEVQVSLGEQNCRDVIRDFTLVQWDNTSFFEPVNDGIRCTSFPSLAN